ncbi:MAG TPA: phosphate ABC transporter substrate-binding protein [Thiotrichales bacterium]|nr:phosphate ABC transporter substrate-binding protein [Thiotrichales bacterium]
MSRREEIHRSIGRLLVAGMAMMAFVIASPSSQAREIQWVGCGISKLGFMRDLATAFEKKTGVKINLEGGGATRGIRDVAAGRSQLGGSCRLPLVVPAEGGGTTIAEPERNVRMIPVGWDALVVIAHQENRLVDEISREQLRKVLVGEITNWRELGAKEARPIHLYVRKGTISGVGLTLRQQLFNNVDQPFAEGATRLKSSGKIEKAVERDPDALAVSGISSSRHRQVRMLKLDGLEPTLENLKRGRYPLFRILFLVAPTDYRQDEDLADFVRFALSREGQKIIEKAGTLPFIRGIGLLHKTSPEYIQTMELIDALDIYTLNGR